MYQGRCQLTPSSSAAYRASDDDDDESDSGGSKPTDRTRSNVDMSATPLEQQMDFVHGVARKTEVIDLAARDKSEAVTRQIDSHMSRLMGIRVDENDQSHPSWAPGPFMKLSGIKDPEQRAQWRRQRHNPRRYRWRERNCRSLRAGTDTS